MCLDKLFCIFDVCNKILYFSIIYVDLWFVYGYLMCMIWLIEIGFVVNIVRCGCGIKYWCIYDYNVYKYCVYSL